MAEKEKERLREIDGKGYKERGNMNRQIKEERKGRQTGTQKDNR